MDLFALGSAAPSTTRWVPQPQESVVPNSQQVRAETAAADAVIPVEGLDVAMNTVTPGAGVPIVFCREVSGIGGCWVSPPCVQYGFVVDASDNVDINYTLVLGQGEYPAIPDADVYYGSVLFNTLTDYDLLKVYQELPYNVITQTVVDGSSSLVGDIPAENGTGGTFEDVTLLGCYGRLTAPATWDRQIHVFMRDGLQVTRYVDSVTGSSNNFADLAKYLLTATGELSTSLIDDESLDLTAQFLEAEEIRFSGVLTGSASLQEYLSRTAPLLLTIYTVNQGRHGLIPALPVEDDYTISTGFVEAAYSYTAADLVVGSLQIQYVPATDRKPFQAIMAWRDPLIPGRTAQTTVNYANRAVSGPFEQYDLTGFCVTEDQAIRVGRYILAQRLYVGHSIQFQLLPSVAAPSVGELFQLRRDIMPNGMTSRRETFFYRVTAVSIAPDGAVSVTAVHFPRTSSGTSQVAQEIVPIATLDAQTPEDWDFLPPYDGAVPPAVMGNVDFISATGGEVYYSGDYKIHIFHRGFKIGSYLTVPPAEINYLEDRPVSRPGLVRYVSFPSDGDGGYLFRTIGSSILTGTTADVDTVANNLIAAADIHQDPSAFFVIRSVPEGATFDYLVVGGGGMAITAGGAGYVSAGGGEVTSGTIAARPGYYYCHVGLAGFAWRSVISNVVQYRGLTEQEYSRSFIYYLNRPFQGGINLADLWYTPAADPDTAGQVLTLAQGGANAVDSLGARDGVSGTLFGVGANNSTTYGGGGGAGGAGYAAPSSVVGGDGGDGITSSILGFPITFGMGGGGGVGNTSVTSPVAGASSVTPGCGGGGVNGNQVPEGTYDTPGIMGRNGLVVIRYRYR